MNRRRFVALALGALLLGGCSATEPEEAVTRDGDVVSGTGTVTYYTLEGGFYAIRGDDATTYDPIKLADEFRHDGLRVRFRARMRPDVGSFHMVGRIVEILEISRL